MMLLAEAAPSMTLAGKLLAWVVCPLLVIFIAAAVSWAFRANRASKARAVADAEYKAEQGARLDTQDGALARLLEVVSPAGQPTLIQVLARIQSDQAAQAQRLADHIRATAADKAAFERRLELIGGGR